MEQTPSQRPEGRGDSSRHARRRDQSQSRSRETSAERENRHMPFSETVPGPSVPQAGPLREDRLSPTPELEGGPPKKRRKLNEETRQEEGRSTSSNPGILHSGGRFERQSEGHDFISSFVRSFEENAPEHQANILKSTLQAEERRQEQEFEDFLNLDAMSLEDFALEEPPADEEPAHLLQHLDHPLTGLRPGPEEEGPFVNPALLRIDHTDFPQASTSIEQLEPPETSPVEVEKTTITGFNIKKDELHQYTIESDLSEPTKRLLNILNNKGSINRIKQRKGINKEEIEDIVENAKTDFHIFYDHMLNGNTSLAQEQLSKMKENAKTFLGQIGVDTYDTALKNLIFTHKTHNNITGFSIKEDELHQYTIESDLIEPIKRFSNTLRKDRINTIKQRKGINKEEIEDIVENAKTDFHIFYDHMLNGNTSLAQEQLSKMKENAKTFLEQTGQIAYYAALKALTFTHETHETHKTGFSIKEDELHQYNIKYEKSEKTLYYVKKPLNSILTDDRINTIRLRKGINKEEIEDIVENAISDFDTFHDHMLKENTSLAWEQLRKMKENAKAFLEQTSQIAYYTALKNLEFVEKSMPTTPEPASQQTAEASRGYQLPITIVLE